MRSCWASIWFLSMSILTSFTAPLASLTTFSIIGCSVLHGPHHGAQKSTMTGTVREASITSLANLVWSLSLMRSAGAACGAAPCSIVSMEPRMGEISCRPQCGPRPPMTQGGDAGGRGWAPEGEPASRGSAVVDLGHDAMNLGGREHGHRAGAVGAGIGCGLGHVGIVDIGPGQRPLAAIQPFDAEIARWIDARGLIKRLRLGIVLGADDRDMRGLAR